MRVLIALDVPAQSIVVVKEAASRPWPARTVFLMLHVLDPFPFAKAPITLKRAKEAADICIALGKRGRPYGEVTVAEVMSSKVYACAPEEDIHAALRTMREGHVRRLPVITEE